MIFYNAKAIIITAPSGAGKTTLVKKLLQERSDLAFSVSAVQDIKEKMR
ncbi:MAG: GTP-binding protein [Chitinophagales bacterium]